jgi:hypothetical protein
MNCTHDLAERETACADGMCPLCLRQEVERLKAAWDESIKERSELMAELKDRVSIPRYVDKLKEAQATIERLQQEKAELLEEWSPPAALTVKDASIQMLQGEVVKAQATIARLREALENVPLPSVKKEENDTFPPVSRFYDWYEGQRRTALIQKEGSE